MKQPTLKDIADRLGISQATVSLALNNRPTVNAKTRQSVLNCVRDLNYTPNMFARGLVTQRSMMIGLVCPDTENPCYGSLVKHFSECCNSQGYSLIVSVSNEDTATEAQCIQGFIDRMCDGIIIMPLNVRENLDSSFMNLLQSTTPFVYCVSYYQGGEDNCVMTDYEDGSYQLTHYLLTHGHRSLWYLVTGDMEVPVARLRLNGYRRAYEQLGLIYNPDWIIPCDNINFRRGYEKIHALLDQRPSPDGILSINDYTTFGVCRAVQEHGLRVPEDISIAGYDDVFYAKIAGIPLTTVRQDLEGIAKNGLRLLLRKINPDRENAQPVECRLRPTLVVRDTTRDRTGT